MALKKDNDSLSIITRYRKAREEVKAVAKNSLTREDLKIRLHWLIYKASPAPIEFASGLFLVFWGIWFLLMPDTMRMSPVWSVLSIMSPRAWGLLSLVLGVTQVYGVMVTCLYCRRVASYLVAVFWFLIVSIKIAVDFTAPVTPVYISIVIYLFWINYRVNRMIRLDEDDPLVSFSKHSR